MAYFRRNFYGGRRHYYRRRNAYTRRRYRRVRRRHRGRRFPYFKQGKRRRTRLLHVTDPRYKAHCTITGWVPIAMTRIQLISQPFTVDTLSPFHVYPGGYGYGVFTLEAMYKEHLMKRNRWSRSNAGFDLGRYLGTWLTLVPHPYFSYLFYYDPEYGNTFEFKKLIHPAIMITHPKTILVLSNKRGGNRRKWPRMWIPRPAIFADGWEFQKDLCQHGLFAFGWAWVDLDRPWMADISKPAQTIDPSTYDKKNDMINKVPNMWWKEAANDWLTEWGRPQGSGVTQQFNQLAMAGPFVLKTNKSEYVNTELLQIILFYKSHFQWGGEFLQDKVLADPTKIPPAQTAYYQQAGQTNLYGSPYKPLSSGLHDSISELPIASPPQNPHKYTVRPSDYDKDGILTEESFRRLTDSPYTSDGGHSFSSFSTASDPLEGTSRYARPLGRKTTREPSRRRKRRRRSPSPEDEETAPIPPKSNSEPSISGPGRATRKQLLQRLFRRLLTSSPQ
ncbi:hypothetical protein [Torque teno tupaia virus]|uniref:Capsid protein n=1 Tax=Torque teno tupaia virus (isolate Tbc-TTV14) TaxID=766185 RepID=CAPSD_TTVD1|nr:hypothetical protein [Torque teno tupaia virus]Q91PQ1.1 RecName: Full=Capsid protein [Torque teno tupaia virus (isolate Tbc-TTV14)]BAB63953.1 hypothetical protein [Torque teno tupaia virus]